MNTDTVTIEPIPPTLPEVVLHEVNCKSCGTKMHVQYRSKKFCGPCNEKRKKEYRPSALMYTRIRDIVDAFGLTGHTTRTRQEVATQCKCTWQAIQNIEAFASEEIHDAFVSDPEFLVAVAPDMARRILKPEVYDAVERPERSILRVTFGGHLMTPKQRLDILTLQQSVQILREEGLTEEAAELEAEIRDLERRIAAIPPIATEPTTTPQVTPEVHEPTL